MYQSVIKLAKIPSIRLLAYGDYANSSLKYYVWKYSNFLFFLKNSGILFQIVGLIQKWSFSSVLVSRKRCFNPRSLFLVFIVFCWSENFIHLSLEFILNKIEYWWADLLLERLIYWQQGQFFEALIPCMFPRV